jgi:hypothetical protein
MKAIITQIEFKLFIDFYEFAFGFNTNLTL